LEATVGDPQNVDEISGGHRRIVPLTGGTFNGPELRGTLVPGASADWDIVLPDSTALEQNAATYAPLLTTYSLDTLPGRSGRFKVSSHPRPLEPKASQPARLGAQRATVPEAVN
jgi:hypothetical protein